MKKIIFLSLTLIPVLLFCTPEEILFKGEKIPAEVWHNPHGEFCLIYYSNIIVIDQWHYAEIDD